MKGIILAGGKGTRLLPLTKITNKHLLPVYNKPMVFYPLQTLLACGISDVLIVSSPDHIDHFRVLMGDGKELGARIAYHVQQDADGIAQALGLGEYFTNGEALAVILGDNIFTDTESIVRGVAAFQKNPCGAKVFLKEVPDAHRFGVAEIVQEKIVSIVEKPKEPKSNLAVTGLYLYDADVFEIIKSLAPSPRGEYEITDVNNMYLQKNMLAHEIVRGEWTDAGTFDSLLRANIIAGNVDAPYIFEELYDRLKGQVRREKE